MYSLPQRYLLLKTRENGFKICFNIRSILLKDVDCWGAWANGVNTSSTFDSTKLHERPGIQSKAAAAVITLDTDMDTSLAEARNTIILFVCPPEFCITIDSCFSWDLQWSQEKTKTMFIPLRPIERPINAHAHT